MATTRPMTTASGRVAWSSEIVENDDFMPEAMAQETAKAKPTSSSQFQSAAAARSTTTTESTSCWPVFLRGLRAIWATKQTEAATEHDQELRIKTTIRELVIYCVFLLTLCVITFGMTSATMYYFTTVMVNLYTTTQWDSSNAQANFINIGLLSDWFSFAGGIAGPNQSTASGSPLLNGLFWENWYNGRNMTPDDIGYVIYENRLMGRIRIRQVRVRNDSCAINSYFRGMLVGCYDSFSSSGELKAPFGEINGTAWTYHTSDELQTQSYSGKVDTYGGGGYYVDLANTSAASQLIIQDLYNSLWLDRATRAVFVDFTLYNANINLFCVVKLIVEFPSTGGAIPTFVFRTVKLLRYVSSMDFFVLGTECLFIFFIFYYTVEEILEIKRLRLTYLKEFWNIFDIVVILISICCIAFDIYRTIYVDSLLDKLLANPDKYYDFDGLSAWQLTFNAALAFMVFCAWVKVFKYISFNKTLTELSATLGASAKDLLGFSIMFFIVFFAFAQLGYLLFGSQNQDFNTIETSIFTLLRVILGDFNFAALQRSNAILGPIYFFTYIFFVFFVLFNMFIAIINDTYTEVKADISAQPDEYNVGDYLKKHTGKLMTKLNLKREKVLTLQAALATADTDGDQQIDFEEWRHNLKMRGYAETEIEAVFNKYDSNGDRILDQKELAKMAADLENQSASIGKEYSELEERGGDDDGDSTGGRRMLTAGAAPLEEFTLLQRRVDRMEHSIGCIVSKIDAVLVKLETMEKANANKIDAVDRCCTRQTRDYGESQCKQD